MGHGGKVLWAPAGLGGMHGTGASGGTKVARHQNASAHTLKRNGVAAWAGNASPPWERLGVGRTSGIVLKLVPNTNYPDVAAPARHEVWGQNLEKLRGAAGSRIPKMVRPLSA